MSSLCAGGADVTGLSSKHQRYQETWLKALCLSFLVGVILGPEALWLLFVCLFVFVFARNLLEVGRFSQGYMRPDVNVCHQAQSAVFLNG